MCFCSLNCLANMGDAGIIVESEADSFEEEKIPFQPVIPVDNTDLAKDIMLDLGEKFKSDKTTK